MTVRVVAAAAALALLVGVFVFNASAKMPDFEVYWRAGARALAAEPLYRAEDGHYQFKYLPAFALLAIPLALLPLGVAKAIWFAASTALVIALLSLSLRLLPERHKRTSLLVTIAVLTMAKFFGHELVLGQVNLLFATIVVLAARCAIGERPIASGLLVAVSVVVKPYAVILLPWLLARRAFEALGAAVAGVAVALVVPLVAYGAGATVALHRDWWRTVFESTAPNLLNPDNVSLAGMFAKWVGPGTAAMWLTALASLLLLSVAGAAVLLRGRVSAPIGLEVALLLTLIPLLSPQGWDYVFLVSTPAVVYVVNYERQLPGVLRGVAWIALATIALSLYDLMGRRAYGAFMAWSVITVCYVIVIGALFALRVRRVA